MTMRDVAGEYFRTTKLTYGSPTTTHERKQNERITRDTTEARSGAVIRCSALFGGGRGKILVAETKNGRWR